MPPNPPDPIYNARTKAKEAEVGLFPATQAARPFKPEAPPTPRLPPLQSRARPLPVTSRPSPPPLPQAGPRSRPGPPRSGGPDPVRRRKREHARAAASSSRPGGGAHGHGPAVTDRAEPPARGAAASRPRPPGELRPGSRARPRGGAAGGGGVEPGRTKSSDSPGEAWPRERARAARLGGWCPDRHAPTPAAGAGGGSASVVRACVLCRWPQCCRAARVYRFLGFLFADRGAAKGPSGRRSLLCLQTEFPVNMEDSSMDASATVSETVVEEVSLFSMTDMILFSLIVGLLTYWFLFRKKKDEIPEFTTIQPMTSSAKDSSFVEKMKKTGRNIIVFYGSQTGTAEEFANRLSKDAHRYGMRGMAADPEEYDLADLGSLPEIENSLAVFCMATYGEGDPTDNAQDFYDWLQETDVDLSGVKYAVFGLGNKTYEHFNAMGKYVDKRLEQLGAQRIFELGMGDDDGNLEEDFITWREQFWPAVCEHFGVEATGEESSIRQYELVVHTDIDMAKVYVGEMGRLKSYENQKPPFDAKNPFLAAVTTNRKLNQGTERHLMHLELDISDSKLRYESGDHVAVYPANDSALVNQLGEILGADLDVVMSLNNLDEESNKKHPFPCPTSYRTALTYYLDITNPPRTNVLYELAQYASEPTEQEHLRKMASSSGEGKELYLSWVVEARRHILAILQDYPSLRPPIDHLCELLPRLQARYYSIASSSKVHPNSVHICAVAVEYQTRSGRINKGVATSWLRAKEPAGENGRRALVPMFVRKSQFRLPFKAATPVIMVGPGTGVAPFIGFIQERAWLRQQGKEVGETLLYYGCRRSDEDYLYREELAQFHQDGSLTQLNVAFSREQPHKVYVQHLLKRDKEHLWQLIHEAGAHIYVCGDARNMARDVQNTFYDIVAEVGAMEHAQAVDYIKKLMTKGRYSLDVWS
uniref:NADPH--cytochrome P450 reductase n=3 Tax=Canis lupus familiaris TaxID=9615 RepID=A0A8C0SL61_CANLF